MRIGGDSILCHIFYLDICGYQGTENLCSFKDHTTCKGKAIGMSSRAISSRSTMLSVNELPSPVFCAPVFCVIGWMDEACAYNFPTIPTCFHSKMAAESPFGNAMQLSPALLHTLSPFPQPQDGLGDGGEPCFEHSLSHSIQLYNSFPLSLPWPQKWRRT